MFDLGFLYPEKKTPANAEPGEGATSKIILNDTSNVTDRVFAIFSKLCKTYKPKFRGSAKHI